MKEIKLTKGKVALVDDNDYADLNSFKWQAAKSATTYYAIRTDRSTKKRMTVRMHRQLLNIAPGDTRI